MVIWFCILKHKRRLKKNQWIFFLESEMTDSQKWIRHSKCLSCGHFRWACSLPQYLCMQCSVILSHYTDTHCKKSSFLLEMPFCSENCWVTVSSIANYKYGLFTPLITIQITVGLYFTVLLRIYILCTYYSNSNNWGYPECTLNLTLTHVVTTYYRYFPL